MDGKPPYHRACKESHNLVIPYHRVLSFLPCRARPPIKLQPHPSPLPLPLFAALVATAARSPLLRCLTAVVDVPRGSAVISCECRCLQFAVLPL